MADLSLSIAINDYDHIRDLLDGKVKAEGIALELDKEMEVEEIFARFTETRCWDVSEMSLARYVSLTSQNDPNLAGIPVFPSRFYRQHAIYVATDRPMDTPEELAGKRVGIPEWVQTAIVWVRAWLMHDVGIPLNDIAWVRAGINSPGRESQVKGVLPEGLNYTEVYDRSLMDMLLAGEIDAIICAHPPDLFQAGDPRIRRLLTDFVAVEEAYGKKHGIFPIMHTVAIPKTTYDAAPWIGPALFAAFTEAKNRSLLRALDGNICRYPIPGAFAYAERARDMYGDDFWPYGVESNRATLEAFVQHCDEQGVTHRRVQVDELYPENVRSL
jgi:4,5-dihydroxyphthalate decarboxylase